MSADKHHIIAGTFWNFLGTILRIFIGIGGSILFVRYLGESDYGISVYLMDTVLLILTLSSIGLGTFQAKVFPALIASRYYSQYKYLFFHNMKIRFFILTILLMIISGCFVFLRSESIDIIKKYFVYFCIFAFLQMMLAVFRGPLQQEYQQRFLNLLNTLFLIIRILLVLIVIYLDLGLEGFLWTEIVVEFIQLFLILQRFRVLVWSKICRVIAEPFRDSIFSRSLYMFAGDFSSKIFSKEFDVLVIGWLFTDEAFNKIALYSLSYLLVLRSFSFLGFGTANSATLLLSYTSDLLSSGGGDKLASLMEKQIKLLIGFVVPLTFGGVLLGEKLLSLLYGESFVGNGLIVRFLFIGYCIYSLTYMTKPLIYALGIERRLIKVRLSLMVVKVGLIMSFVSGHSLNRFVFVSVVVLALLGLIEMGILCRNVSLFRFPLSYTLKIGIASGVMTVVVSFFHVPHFGQSLSLLLEICAGSLIYIFSLYLLKPFSLDDCKLLWQNNPGKRINLGKILSHFAH